MCFPLGHLGRFQFPSLRYRFGSLGVDYAHRMANTISLYGWLEQMAKRLEVGSRIRLIEGEVLDIKNLIFWIVIPLNIKYVSVIRINSHCVEW